MTNVAATIVGTIIVVGVGLLAMRRYPPAPVDPVTAARYRPLRLTLLAIAIALVLSGLLARLVH